MANTLFIIKDDVFGALPEAVQRTLLTEVKKLFSFIPNFTVEARNPALFPATIHFTDSVVKLIESDGDLTGVLNEMLRKEDSNIPVSYTHLDVYKRQS